MSVRPPVTWRPPLLARPTHGLLARNGWVWLAGPGAGLLIAGIVVSGLQGPAPHSHYGVGRTLVGYVLLLGLVLLVVGLPVRAVVVGKHRRSWAPDASLPSLGGVYPHGSPAAGHHLVRHGGAHKATGIVLLVFVVCIIGGFVALAVGGLIQGIHVQRLQHSSDAVRITATLDRNTTTYHGRGTTYTDQVSYVVGGRVEHDVVISADRAQRAGDPVAIVVEPHDPRDAVAASDHGYDDLIIGGVGTLGLAFPIVVTLADRRRKRRLTHSV